MADERQDNNFEQEENTKPQNGGAEEQNFQATEQNENTASEQQYNGETKTEYKNAEEKKTQDYYRPNYTGYTNYNSESPKHKYDASGGYYPPASGGYSFYNSQTSGHQFDARQNPGFSNQPRPDESFGNTPNIEVRKKKKNNSGVIAVCIILSLICGFAGAFGGMYLYSTLNKGAFSGGSTVIYQSVEKESNDTPSVEDEIGEGIVAQITAKTQDSVVEITTETVQTNSFYGQYISEGAGSGVIISEDGYIITNNHVISGASTITVRLHNTEEYKATLRGTDSENDIAVIKIEANNLKPATIGSSSDLVVGEMAVAIGNPLGKLGGTVTNGIISALDREITIEGEKMTLLQTNASINPGNSGGGLFDKDGNLIGIVVAKSSGNNIEGLGFAIPIDTAKAVAEDLITNGYVSGRPSIGITVEEINSQNFFYYNVNELGVYITSSQNPNLYVGDRIVAVEGNTVSTTADVKSVINDYKIGDEITITVSRRNKILDVKVTLIESQVNETQPNADK